MLDQKNVPIHPTITKMQISQMVDEFYIRIADDPRLGPIFLSRNKGDWADHLDTMKKFWSSVLLRSGEYKGQPVVKHNQIHEITTQDFLLWYALFEHTAHKVFHKDAVPLVLEVAKRIGNSLWLAKLGKVSDTPPFNQS